MFQKLRAALGGMCSIPQWFVWRLTWDADKNKYDKKPARPDGLAYFADAADPENWHSFDNAVSILASLSEQDTTHKFALGFYFTADCGYWFFDVDSCTAEPYGEVSDIAKWAIGQFPGAAFEYSSSGRGIHLFGRGTLPASDAPYRTRPIKEYPYALEFYTSGRGCAFGLSGEAWGSADTDHTQSLGTIIPVVFKPDPVVEHGDGARADWRGPADDDELLARAMRAESAASRFTGKPTFRDLFTNNVPVLAAYYGTDKDSEIDAALAAHLAFWTGCDAERIERLMRRSALYRAKWDDHRTYLSGLTIPHAIARQRDVYQEPVRTTAAATALYGNAAPGVPVADVVTTTVVGDLVTVEQQAIVDKLLDLVTSCSDLAHMHNAVIPAIRAACVVPALLPRLVTAVNRQLELWDGKLPVGQLRSLLAPPMSARAAGDSPEWCKKHVFLLNGDRFFNIENARAMSRTGFNATYDRSMPMRENGQREEAAQWCLQRWDIPTVFDVMYRPGFPAVFEWGGEHYANSFSATRLPAAAEVYTAQGVQAIERFVAHLWFLVDKRTAVYEQLICWMAHNVQYPGVKIRHAPLIKGVEGDGKSIITSVMRAVMGFRNVSSVGPETICNSGGFTDWAHGAAVITFEELMMVGADRYRVANMIKPFITNDVVTINPKGRPGYQVLNHANQIAYSNHNDAAAINVGNERRWFVIFTPYSSLDDMVEQMCFADRAELAAHFKVMFDALSQVPGEFRKWLLEFPIPKSYDPNANAMDTAEKARMAVSGLDDAEVVARSIVEDGAYGINKKALSSGELSKQLKMRALADNFDIPQTNRLNHMLSRMGFSQYEHVIKWDGKSHRAWVRGMRGISRESIRLILESTKNAANP